MSYVKNFIGGICMGAVIDLPLNLLYTSSYTILWLLGTVGYVCAVGTALGTVYVVIDKHRTKKDLVLSVFTGCGILTTVLWVHH